ncbi:YqgU-like beta propeller domain-containing protein [Bacillus sp. AK031]
MKSVQSFILMLLCLLLLASCNGNSPDENTPYKPGPEVEQEPQAPEVREKELTPLHIEESAFFRALDWLDNDQVLLLTKENDENQLSAYNIYNGEKEILYTDNEYIVDAKISPDRNRILIHTAPLTYSATVTIIDLEGEVLFQEDIDSYEVSFEWNGINSDLLFITSFSEDWTYTTNLANVSEGTLTEVDSPQPFVKWHSENSFLYQDWPEDSISLTAPLYSQNIFSGEQSLIEEDTVHFNTMEPFILSVSMNEEAEGEGIYQFITEEGTIASDFSQPLLSSYSNWLIPYYDKIDDENTAVTLTASASGPADAYQDKFTLERWNIETGEREEIMTGLDNEPLQCSPSGEYCLIGYELKKAVDLSSKEAAGLIIVE